MASFTLCCFPVSVLCAVFFLLCRGLWFPCKHEDPCYPSAKPSSGTGSDCLTRGAGGGCGAPSGEGMSPRTWNGVLNVEPLTLLSHWPPSPDLV